MPTCSETCKTGLTFGGIAGGLTGFALDVWLSMVYVRPFVNHVTNTNDKTEEIITGAIAILALPLFIVPTMWVGKIIGPPTAIALRNIYECGSNSFSTLSNYSLFRRKQTQTPTPINKEEGGGEEPLVPSSPMSMV